MKYPAVIKVNLEEETAVLAKEFSSEIRKGDVLVLKGDLGAGKTYFIKNLLKHFGIKNVNSPTFAIVNEYKNGMIFYHFDFYRLKEEKELFDIGFQDYMNNQEAVKLIEWGELFSSLLPRKRIEITIHFKQDSSREFIFNKYE